MKGIDKIPSINELAEIYALLNGDGLSPSVLSRASQYSRFDGRLAELVVNYLFNHWKIISPLDLNSATISESWPAALGVLLEFAGNKVKAKPEKSEETQFKFELWKKLVLCGIKPADGEQFFIGLRKIGGKLMLQDVLFTLDEYAVWGYFGREQLFNKATSVVDFKTGRRRRGTRELILRDLLNRHSRITAKMYWEAIDRVVSLRQAERDLRTSKFVTGTGRTKGRFYR